MAYRSTTGIWSSVKACLGRSVISRRASWPAMACCSPRLNTTTAFRAYSRTPSIGSRDLRVDIPSVFGNRPFAVIGASPGGFGTILAQNDWLPVLKTLGVRQWSGGRLMVSRAHKVFNEVGELIDESTQKGLRDFMRDFLQIRPERSLTGPALPPGTTLAVRRTDTRAGRLSRCRRLLVTTFDNGVLLQQAVDRQPVRVAGHALGVFRGGTRGVVPCGQTREASHDRTAVVGSVHGVRRGGRWAFQSGQGSEAVRAVSGSLLSVALLFRADR